GHQAAIIRTDSLFRGVLVPPGDHEVTFSYEPEPVAVGAAATVGTALVLILFFAIPELERARRRVPWTRPWPKLAVARPRWPSFGRSATRDVMATVHGPAAQPVR